jgi:hypothetical protein
LGLQVIASEMDVTDGPALEGAGGNVSGLATERDNPMAHTSHGRWNTWPNPIPMGSKALTNSASADHRPALVKAQLSTGKTSSAAQAFLDQ